MLVPKIWGYEDIAVNTDEYCGKRMFIQEQYRCSIHHHVVKDEVLMVGPEGLLYFETGESPSQMNGFFMEENSRIRITPNMWHRFTAIRDTYIYEFSTHDDSEDSIRDEKSGKLSDSEYKALLQQYIRSQTSRNQWLEIGEAKELAAVHRAKNQTIGMCNGCFDLLHLGHVQLLSSAKERCDILFVGCNDDAAVTQLKGLSRPFVNAIGRLGMLSACKYVDYVVRIPNTNCLDLVDAIRPDLYVTTTEYGDTGIESVEVKKQGGKVAVVGMIPQFNTTGLSLAIQQKKGLGK